MSNEKQGSLSIHPYIGGTTLNLIRNVIKHGGVSKKNIATFSVTLFGTICLLPLRAIEAVCFSKKIAQTELAEDPIFIIGHWRSGTTHLHNVVSQDSRLGYLSTLHAIFPTCCVTLSKNKFLKNLIANLLPEKRMMDNVKMGLDYPQEEEFSLSCVTTSSHHCNHFPSTITESFDQYVLHNVSDKEREKWKKTYMKTIRKASYMANGKRLALKNPYNTARLEILLEMFPNAKFIHIYRNPYTIYVSALHDFIKEAEEMALQDFTENEFAAICYQLYEKLMKKYWETRDLVPKGNLSEVAFEDFEKNPLSEMKRIYTELNLDLNEEQLDNVTQYLDSLSDYKRNKYTFSSSLVDEISKKWGFALEKLNYSLPPDILVNDEENWTCKM